MKAIKKGLKPIAFLLTALLLFQSCVVYRTTTTTLEKASQERIKTKVVNTNELISRFDYITFEEGQFYGVYKDFDERGKLVITPLSEQEISKVLTKDKTASILVTIGAIAIPVIAISIIGIASYDPF